jgi:uncharacterized protein (TIGR02099 family)
VQNSVFHKLSNVLWGLMVVAIVVLAVYVSLGRLLSTNLQSFQREILAELSLRVPFDIDAEQLSGEWRSFTPELVLSGLTLTAPGQSGEALELSGGRVGLDVLDSLLTRSLQISSLRLDGLALNGELTPQGRFILPGLTGDGGEIGAWLREFLLNIEYVTLQDNSLNLALPGGDIRKLDLNLHMMRAGSTRRLSAQLRSALGSSIELIGNGVGDPFKLENFSGDLYLAVQSGDLGGVRDMLANPPVIWAEGNLDAELWLSWEQGQPKLDFSLAAGDLLLRPTDGDWAVPLDELSLQASLVERKNRWTLFLSDLVARHGEAEAVLPRMQLDAWGESLRVRSEELSLAPLSTLALALGALPEAVTGVLEVLQPAGNLSALELNIGDLGEPLTSWEVEANFDQVQVDSWRGAPGVTAASGYLELSEAGGSVVLDSQQFTMNFPTVYRQPLYYDDFFGTLNLSWDSESLVLDSGIITAQAVEGMARALFRLNIPFSQTDVGLEMDLLVGLENSHPIHRVKYIPYTLSDTLLEWLSGAVGEGDVDQGAFLWRGSLRRGAADLRTVQLFLNVSNTSLNYHPQWPGVRSVNGVVLIDDTSVSVWADSAKLYDSIARRLSAETWLGDDGQMMLAVEGTLVGPAEDGLRVVNESLLGELVKGVFSDWQATGELETHLQLQLNLADKTAPPVVDVHTRWEGVDLLINPGRLQIRQLSGVLDYTSAAGFSSRDLAGNLWGEPVSADVQQRLLEAEPGAAMDFGNSLLDVGLVSRVNTADVQEWLDLQALSLATGSAAVSGNVRVAPGEAPVLSLFSELEGVSLDLPSPWSKASETVRHLALEMPLGAPQSVLSVELGTELGLLLDITAGRLKSAALGVNAEPPALLDAKVSVAGRAPLVDVQEWLDFSEKYLLADAPVTGAAPKPGLEEPGDPNEAAVQGSGGGLTSLELLIRDFHADTVRIWGLEAGDVGFNLAYSKEKWQVNASTDWLQGSFLQPEGERAVLVLDYLDLDGIAQLESVAAETEEEMAAVAEPLDVPALDARIARLERQGRQLGNLSFQLDTEGATVHAREIVGELAGMSIQAESPASLSWEQGVATQLNADLQFADFGESLEQLGYARFLETDSGELSLSLGWPGSPQGFAMQEATGELAISSTAGRFLETPAGATGALKVVAVLNLAEVVQRLSLSHMFESGITFNTMDGEILLRDGLIDVPRFEVKGASSGFSFNGESDIASRSLDGELVATLPVASNLPWVAALAAGLPVAAGVFVVSKVFEKQVNRLSSGVYEVGGTWDDPEVTFDRIFDDASRQVVREFIDPNSPAVAPGDPNNAPQLP